MISGWGGGVKEENRIGESGVEFFTLCVEGREGGKEGERGKGKGEWWKKGKKRKRRGGFVVDTVKQPCWATVA